jgi:hypothetical protein
MFTELLSAAASIGNLTSARLSAAKSCAKGVVAGSDVSSGDPRKSRLAGSGRLQNPPDPSTLS